MNDSGVLDALALQEREQKAASAVSVSESDETNSPNNTADPTGDLAGLAGTKVLVVDDSNTIRRSADVFLKHAQCEVILAQDGFEALAKVAQHRPDVIFCDVMMPRLDGYQTCELLKKSSAFGDIPVVMLSSKDSLFDRARGNIVGSSEYLTKPFSRESLLQAVRDNTRGQVA